MVWACMSAIQNWLTRIYCQYAAGRILSAQIQSNALKLIGWCFIVQVDNDQKHNSQETKDFLEQRSAIFYQLPDLNPIEHAIHLLKVKLIVKCPKNKQKLTTVKAWY